MLTMATIPTTSHAQVDEARINSMISRRVLARHARDYATADRLRDELRREGVEATACRQTDRQIDGRKEARTSTYDATNLASNYYTLTACVCTTACHCLLTAD